MVGIGEPNGLLAVDFFLHVPLEEGIRDIQLVGRPPLGRDDGEDGADHGRLDDGCEHLPKVDAGSLVEATDDPSCLIALEGAVRPELVFEYPLPGDDSTAGGAVHQCPCSVADERLIFGLNGLEPVGVTQSHAGRRGHGQDGHHCGRHGVLGIGLVDAGLGPGHHLVGRCCWRGVDGDGVGVGLSESTGGVASTAISAWIEGVVGVGDAEGRCGVHGHAGPWRRGGHVRWTIGWSLLGDGAEVILGVV